MVERKYKCTHKGCKKVFNRRDYLERHATNHLQVKPYVCYQCARQFSRRDLYENHLATKFHSRRAAQAGAAAPLGDPTAQQMDSMAPLLPNGEIVEPQTNLMGPIHPLGMMQEDDYFRSQDALEFNDSMSVTPKSYDLQNSLLTQSIPSEFESSSYYNSLSGLESDRWDYYRPFKQLPAISDYMDTESAPKKHEKARPGSSGGSSEEGSEISSQSEGGSNTNSSNTAETSLTSGSTQRAGAPSKPNTATAPNLDELSAANRDADGSAPAAAYKMWLIDRFQDDQEVESSLREPEGSDPAFEKKYQWFFEQDLETSEQGKYGYIGEYTDTTRMYKERTLKYQVANWPSTNDPRISMPKTTNERSTLIARILASGASSILTGGPDADKYIETAWKKAQVVSCIVHWPTFDPNTAHPALVAVLVLVGMALSSDEEAGRIAKLASPNVSLFIYESLNQPEGPMSIRYSAAYVGHFMAFCLMFKYEPIIIGRDLYASSLIRAASCRRSADKFITKLIASVSQIGLVPSVLDQPVSSRREPVWATITRDSYVFHPGYDQEAQWREWAAYEMCKRTVLFTVYYDGVISKCDTDQTFSEISLFNLDIHSPVPDSIWLARSSTEFFYGLGPSAMLCNVPYLGVIQSLLRPAVKEEIGARADEPHTPISFFMFRMVAHGLMNITSRLFGIFDQGERVMEALVGALQPSIALRPSPILHPDIQQRLFHGLDSWFTRFEQSYGKITERLFKKNGSLGIRISNEMSNNPVEDNEQHSLPQYALYLVIYHYSSFIVVHEDLPVVLQVTTNLEKWLKQDNGQLVEQKKLFEYIYMPLYVQWSRSDEAAIVMTTSAKFLLWMDAATGQIETKSWNQLFFSAVAFTSVISIWIFDLVAYYTTHEADISGYSAGKVELRNYEFMVQALDYLWRVSGHPKRRSTSPGPPPVLSVLLMGACILYTRPHTKSLYEQLEQLICVLDPSLNPDRVRLVLEGAREMFKTRYQELKEESSPN